MKKLILSAMAVCAFGFASAQDMNFGVKAGANLANLSGDLEDAKSLFGAHVGAFVEFKFTDNMAFQPELLYSMQGAKEEVSETIMGFTANGESTYKLGYLNIPLMFKYYATEALYIEAGPQVGFLMSAKEEWSYSSNVPGDENGSGEEDIKEGMKSIDFGLNIGAGYYVTDNLSLGLRYNFGLSNISDSDNFEMKNGVFQFSVGYKF
jgi:opacity protein-like surface antigen